MAFACRQRRRLCTHQRAKSRLVARGDRCEKGVHYTETHAPVVHFTTTRTFISMACARGWSISQMDVKTAFINADIDNQDIYFDLPDGYKQHREVNGQRMCLKAKRALYGLPQSPRLWNRKFTQWLKSKGFKPTNKDPCYYTLKAGGEEIHLICYVDDLAFAGSNATVLAAFREALQRDFQMQDMGMLNWFLGCEIIQDLAAGTTKLVQTKYINDMLARFDFMSDIQGVDSPSPHNSKPLSKAKCPADPAQADKDLWWRPFYRPLIGSLLYAAVLSRPDIATEVNMLSQFLQNPAQEHWDAAVHVLAYLKNTPTEGITYTRSVNRTDIFNVLFIFVDATWATDVDDRRSTSGMVCMLNGGAISWKSKKQPIIAQSSCESEIIAATSGANEGAFLRDLLDEIGCPQTCTTMYEDNQACRQIVENPGALRERSKHFELRFLKIQEYAERGMIRMVQVPTKFQLADMLTKRLDPGNHQRLRRMILGHDAFDHRRYFAESNN